APPPRRRVRGRWLGALQGRRGGGGARPLSVTARLPAQAIGIQLELSAFQDLTGASEKIKPAAGDIAAGLTELGHSIQAGVSSPKRRRLEGLGRTVTPLAKPSKRQNFAAVNVASRKAQA